MTWRRGIILRVDITKMKLRDVLSDEPCHSLIISLTTQFLEKGQSGFICITKISLDR